MGADVKNGDVFIFIGNSCKLIKHGCDREQREFETRQAERLQKSAPLTEEMMQWLENEGLYYGERTLLGKPSHTHTTDGLI